MQNWAEKDVFLPTIWNESLCKTSNDNDVRIVCFVTPHNLILTIIMFPHWSIYKCIYVSPDGNACNQTDHILIVRRWPLGKLDAWP